MTDSALVPSQVDPDVSAALVVYERMKPLKDALAISNLTDGEMQVFAMVCHHTGLDPFTKQIYAIKRAGRVTHQTGIDGYRSSAERTKEYRGTDEPTFQACECGAADSPPDHPKLARIVVYRAYPDGIRGQVGIARWHELKPLHWKPEGAREYQDAMWWKQPYNQLAKCAEAAALRKAFPRVFGGVYIREEMEQAETIDGTAERVAPTAAERIAERRARAEQRGRQEAVEGEYTEASAEEERAQEGAAVAPSAAPAPPEIGERPNVPNAAPLTCGAPSPFTPTATCDRPAGHHGVHGNEAEKETWPQERER